jgi:CBS domain-containing protein
MKAAAIMTSNVATCRAEDNLSSVARIMIEQDCGSVPVVDDQGRVIGIVSDRDICIAAHDKGMRLAEMRASDAMTRGVVTAAPDDSVGAVERRMQDRQVRRIPIVQDGQLVGIISMGDIAKLSRSTEARDSDELAPTYVAETLAAISEQRVMRAPLATAE